MTRGEIFVDKKCQTSYILSMNELPEKYKTKDLAAITGATLPQVANWVKIGAIQPVSNPRGRGQSRIFDAQGLVEAFVCKEMSNYRVENWIIVETLQALRDGNRPLLEAERRLSGRPPDNSTPFWRAFQEDRSIAKDLWLFVNVRNFEDLLKIEDRLDFELTAWERSWVYWGKYSDVTDEIQESFLSGLLLCLWPHFSYAYGSLYGYADEE
jgi:hypothetical protein